MRKSLVLASLAVLVVACGRKESYPSPAFVAPPEVAAQRVAPEPHTAKTLAYEHTVRMQVPTGEVIKVHSKVQQACAEAGASGCVVLESRIESGRNTSAFLKLRAEPTAVRKLMASFGELGEIASQSTEAEDLAEPIADGQKALAMKLEYRGRLETLLSKASTDVDSLIKVNKELAAVQSEIDTLTGRNAFLKKRTTTEVLSLTISPSLLGSAWGSLTDLASGINRNLADGTLSAISTVAFVIPWIALLLAITYVIVLLRRRRRSRADA